MKQQHERAAGIQSQSRGEAQQAEARIIAQVARKTGWTEAYAKVQMDAARERLGIEYADYAKHHFFELSQQEQDAKYEEIFQRIEKYIPKVMELTGESYEVTKQKMKEARARTGCRADEYFRYHFWELDEETQKTFFLACHSRKIREKYPIKRGKGQYASDKVNCYRAFSKYVKRKWCVNQEISRAEFVRMFADCGRIIYKPAEGHAGGGTRAFSIDRENADKLYDLLAAQPRGMVEEYIVQHPALAAFNPDCVNTLRIATVYSKGAPVAADGTDCAIAYAMFNIGLENSVTDNDGLAAGIDIETGEIVTDAADEYTTKVFTHAPLTGKKIKGFVIPYFAEAIAMIKQACREMNMGGYFGWDVAITADGPMLIEVNSRPGAGALQRPYAAEKIGMKPMMARYMERPEELRRTAATRDGEVTIRVMEKEDVPATVDIQIASWRAAYQGLIADRTLQAMNRETMIERRMQHYQKDGFIVAETGGEIVGFCRFYSRNRKKNQMPGTDCDIYLLHVEPAHTGQGVGTALFQYVIDLEKRRGNQRLLVWCLRDHVPGIRFCRKMGGKIASERMIKIGGRTYPQIGFVYPLTLRNRFRDHPIVRRLRK